MKDYCKGVYADLKNGSLEYKIYFIVALIGTLPVIFSALAMDACHNGAKVEHAAYITVLNAFILWVFIALALL